MWAGVSVCECVGMCVRWVCMCRHCAVNSEK